MTPEERNRMEKMEKLLDSILRVENVPFIESLQQRLDFFTGTPKLSDLSDVENTDSATTGQVLKKTSTTWQPGSDNIA